MTNVEDVEIVKERTAGSNGQTVVTNRSWTLSPGRALAIGLGIFLTLVGAVVMIRTGLDSDLMKPTTEIFGITQNAAVGMVEVVAGLLLILSAVSEAGRITAGVVGMFAIIAGIVTVSATVEWKADAGVTNETGWFFMLWGGVAILAAMLPSVRRRSYNETRST